MEPNFGYPTFKRLKVLDFDIENRPSSYWYDDKTTSEITAIAWSLGNSVEPWRTPEQFLVEVAVLAPPPNGEASMHSMLENFRRAYDEADMVTGHYIRKHDLPIINSHMIEFGYGPLKPKLTSDTKLDLVTYGGQSASQMGLANTLGVKKEKPRMSVNRWRDANRLTPEGREATIERVVGDVRQHMELRLAVIREGMLKAPVVWTP